MPGYDYPCPCCGYLAYSEPPGSDGICVVCGWEDDAVQAANPCTGGGANAESLAEAQDNFEFTTPAADLDDLRQRGFVRDTQWRRLTVTEKDLFRKESSDGRQWVNPAITNPSEYYWRRNVVAEKT